MTAPQPSTPEEFAGDCDCPYPRHQSMCSACKLAARIRERDAALLAPLHAHLEFVGRVAEAIGARACSTVWMQPLDAEVYFDTPPSNDLPPPSPGERDLCWSALLAALAALEER